MEGLGVWWYMLMMPALGRWRKEEVEVSLGYIRPASSKQANKQSKTHQPTYKQQQRKQKELGVLMSWALG